jgi:UDPglucose 6-dehydrogenase
MKVAVVGTGYLGLATGIALAYVGHHVTCIDVDEDKIERLRRHDPPAHEPWVAELMALSEGRLDFTTRYDGAIPEAEVVVLATGTPPLPDGTPDMQFMWAAAQAVGEHLGDGFTVVATKSTVPAGSGPRLETLIGAAAEQRRGRREPPRFAVASNPEFVREGSALHDSLYPDRIVIGVRDARAAALLATLYRPIVEQTFPSPAFLPRPAALKTVPLLTMDLASAELTKYAANAFIAMKLSFIKEVARLAEQVGADITQVATGIGLDERIGARYLQAGIGWGGSCLAKDTLGLIADGRAHGLAMPMVQAARDVNDGQRTWVVDKLAAALGGLAGRTVGLLGLAFKPHTDDLRDAPALAIASRLISMGAIVRAHDPVALERARLEHPESGIHYCAHVAEVAADADALVLATEWPEYRTLPWRELAGRMRTAVLLDGRNALERDELQRAGFTYLGMGR